MLIFFVRVTPESAYPIVGVAARRIEEGFDGWDAGGYNAYGSFQAGKGGQVVSWIDNNRESVGAKDSPSPNHEVH
jgi:hypothetical protein